MIDVNEAIARARAAGVYKDVYIGWPGVA